MRRDNLLSTFNNLKLEKVNTDDFQTEISYDILKLQGVQAGVFKGYRWFIYFVSKKSYSWFVNNKPMKNPDMYHIHVEYKPTKIPFGEYQEYLYKYLYDNKIKVSELLTETIFNNYRWLDGSEVNFLKGTLHNSGFEEARKCIFQYINVFNEINKKNLVF